MKRLHLLLPLCALAGILLAFAFAGAGCNGGGGGRNVLDAPTMVAATGGDGVITVTWAEAPGAESYFVYWARDPNVDTDNYDSLPGGQRTEVDEPLFEPGIDNGETWWFLVSGISADRREGDPSGTVVGAASPWGPAALLDTTAGDALTPDVATATGGSTHAIWTRQVAGRYGIQSSVRTGPAWSAPANLDDALSGNSYSPRVAVAGNATALAVWRQGTGVQDDVWANRFATGTWGTAVRLETQSGPARNPVVAAAPSGNGIALWSGTGGNLQAAVFNGAAWGAAQDVDVTGAADYPDAALDAAGNGAAVWERDGRIYASRFTGAFGAPVLVSNTSGASAPKLAIQPATGNGIAVWVQAVGNDSNIASSRYTFATNTWTPPEFVESHPLPASNPRISLHSSGRAMAVWKQNVGARDTVGRARFLPGGGGAWLAVTLFDADPSGSASDPVVGFDANGDALAVWSQQVVDLGGPGVTENIYSMQIAVQDTTQEYPAMVVSKYGGNTFPALVVGSSGVATAAWLRYGVGGNEVWFNRVTP